MDEVNFFAITIRQLEKSLFIDAENALNLAVYYLRGDLTMSQVKSLLELVNSTDPAMLNVIIANVVTRNKNGSNDEYNKDTSIAKQKAKRLMRHDQIRTDYIYCASS